MAEYPQYLIEKQEIDRVMTLGYQIYDMKDHLNGTDVLLKKPETSESITLHVSNANARKYLTTMLSLQLTSERRHI